MAICKVFYGYMLDNWNYSSLFTNTCFSAMFMMTTDGYFLEEISHIYLSVIEPFHSIMVMYCQIVSGSNEL